MSAVFKERPVDIEILSAECWEDLGREEKRDCLELAMQENPDLIAKFYTEAMSAGVDPFDYFEDL